MFTRKILSNIFPITFQIVKSGAPSTKQCLKNLTNCHVASSLIINKFPCRLFSEQAKPEAVTVDYEQVKKATSDKNVLIIDVREPDEIKEHGKIPNSINIPLGTVTPVLDTMPENEFQKTYQRAKPSKETEMIFYCMIGKRSGMAQQNAINLGFKNTKNYLGSWTDWATKMQ